MDAKNKGPDDKVLIAFSDLISLCYKARKKIFLGTAIGMTLATYYTLVKPIQYSAEATFREKGKSGSGIPSSLTALLFNNSTPSQGSEAINTMKSRKVLEPLIREMGLQGSFAEQRSSSGKLSNIFQNLQTSYAYFRHRQTPLFADQNHPLVCCQVHYLAEVPLDLQITFTADDTFLVSDHAKHPPQRWGEGKVGIPFSHNGVQFTLLGNPPSGATQKFQPSTHLLHFEPMLGVVKELSSSIAIQPDKKDPSLLKIHYENSHRLLASKIINNLMLEYHNYLQNTYDKQVEKQLNYLKERQEGSYTQLKNEMLAQADSIADDISTSGSLDPEKELEFLSQNHYTIKKRLLEIDLETKRIHKLQQAAPSTYLTQINDPAAFDTLNEIKSLKQQRDSLMIALRQAPGKPIEQIKADFSAQVRHLESVQHYLKVLQIVQKEFTGEKTPSFPPEILQDPGIMLGIWHEELRSKERAFETAGPREKQTRKEQWTSCKTNCLAYLANLQSLYLVQEKLLQERLALQHATPVEFQGIDLNSSREFYKNYNAQLHETQAQSRQYAFIIAQLQDPQFEVTALSPTLTDSVSQAMISKTSELSLKLKDQRNRSDKEQVRILEDLSHQRAFLIGHIDHTMQLTHLREKLIQEKIQALQSTTLELISQQLSISEQYIVDYLNSRIHYLAQERLLIEKQMEKLQNAMSLLPKKWVADQLIKLRLQQNTKMVEEISKLVETKNITHNLEIIQSGPLDEAVPPPLPKARHLLLFALFGSFCGAFLTAGFVLARSILVKGVPASQQNIELAGQYVAGKLSSRCHRRVDGQPPAPLIDQDLETLRRLTSAIIQKGDGHKVLAAILGQGPDYTYYLAQLLATQGRKVLHIALTFDTALKQNSNEGIFDYLSGQVAAPPIVKGSAYDTLAAGGVTRHSNELLKTPLFQKLLTQMQAQYDLIIVASSAAPLSAAAESLFDAFAYAAITITDEPLPALKHYTAASSSHKQVVFLMA